MAGAIVVARNRPGPELPEPDWAGGFYLPPRSAPTSTRMEGLIAITDLLAALPLRGVFAASADPSRVGLLAESPHSTTTTALTDVEDTLCSAADYLLGTQFRPGSALFLAEPERVLGAFRRSLTNFQLRIDTSQHAISALLGLARLHESGRVTCGRAEGGR